MLYGIDETSSEEDSDTDEFETEAETAELDLTAEELVDVEARTASNNPTLLTPDSTPVKA